MKKSTVSQHTGHVPQVFCPRAHTKTFCASLFSTAVQDFNYLPHYVATITSSSSFVHSKTNLISQWLLQQLYWQYDNPLLKQNTLDGLKGNKNEKEAPTAVAEATAAHWRLHSWASSRAWGWWLRRNLQATCTPCCQLELPQSSHKHGQQSPAAVEWAMWPPPQTWSVRECSWTPTL